MSSVNLKEKVVSVKTHFADWKTFVTSYCFSLSSSTIFISRISFADSFMRVLVFCPSFKFKSEKKSEKENDTEF